MLVTVYSERSKTTDERGIPRSFFFRPQRTGEGEINIQAVYNISYIHITYNIEVLRLGDTILWKESAIS
jgi:hypothetical protein